MSTSVYQFVSTMTPRFATEVLKPVALTANAPGKTLPPLFVYQCGECPRKFNRRYALQEHLATHTGEKAYVCPAPGCSKRFSTTSNLARHRRLHGEELQPLACPVLQCPKTFTTAHKLRRHMRVHLGTPTRRCKFANCSKTFSSTGNLNRHMRNQHIRFGHPLACGTPEEQSPTSVDVEPTSMFSWDVDSFEQDEAEDNCQQMDVGTDCPGGHDVSDADLLEVLSWLWEDGQASDDGGESGVEL
ncbi:hypothetical protein BBJ28_00010689 [Nothophytophthora sp. Chile5]|nr:hypothetical protein BBJ28_00010689 [Nothophytophthora sp. Chile5]